MGWGAESAADRTNTLTSWEGLGLWSLTSGTGGGTVHCGLEVSSGPASVMLAQCIANSLHSLQPNALPLFPMEWSLSWGESWTPASEAVGRNHPPDLWFSDRNLI